MRRSSRGLFRESDLRGRELGELRAEPDREYLSLLCRDTRGDLGAMMARLGVGRTQLYAMFRRVGLDIRELRRRAGVREAP